MQKIVENVTPEVLISIPAPKADLLAEFRAARETLIQEREAIGARIREIEALVQGDKSPTKKKHSAQEAFSAPIPAPLAEARATDALPQTLAV